MSNNPLKQYFRRPAIYISLPSEGKYYPPGVVEFPPNRELPVYPMTSLDEMTAKNAEGLFNGDSTVRIIKSCVPSILDPWKLNSIDLEAIIIAIRAASTADNTIDMTSTCPSCNETSRYGINLTKILNEKINVDYDTTLKIRDMEIKFRPLTYTETNKNSIDQFGLQRTLIMLDEMEDIVKKKELMDKAVADMNTMMYNILTSTIEYIQTPETTVREPEFIHEFLIETDSRTSDTIKQHSIDLRRKNDTRPMKMKCTHCEHEYEQALVLNFSDFFV